MKTKITFPHTAKLFKSAREQTKISQLELALNLGYTTPQIISNIERMICGLPAENWKRAAHMLNIKPLEIMEAQLLDEALSFFARSKIQPTNLILNLL